MSEASKPSKFSVAVIGGGIGGLSLVLGLLKHDHIDVQVYEAAPSFGEIGAGVVVGLNAQRALKLITPHAFESFKKHATSNLWESHADIFIRYVYGKIGEHEGEIVCDQKIEGGIQTVHRAQFLDELVKGVPSERAHFNKRLLSIENSEDSGSVLRFADGTTAKADAVIGADGIHSIVREHILGESDIACRSTFADAVVYRGLVTIEKAVEKVGEEYAHNSMMVCGPGKAIFSYPIDHGRQFNIVAANLDDPKWESDKWVLPATYSELADLFDGWGALSHKLIELFDIPNLVKWGLRDSIPAATYTLGNVAMMGDAAHASTPFQGQGAGQAMEDALVLETLLGRVQDAKHIQNAFAAYDQVRKARSQRVVTTSRESGMLFAMKVKGVGEDFDKIKAKTETRMNWIWGRNLERQNAEAIALYEESL